MVNIDTLKKELQATARKIKDGYVMSNFEKTEFALSCGFLFDMVGYDFDLLVALKRMTLPIEEMDKTIMICKEFTDVIKHRLFEILFNTDIDEGLLDEKNIYCRDDLKTEILKFYKGFDRKHYKLIRELVFDNERFKIIPYAEISCYDMDRRSACSAHFNNKSYVYIATGKSHYPGPLGPYQMFAKTATIHELGHVISFSYSDKHKNLETAFREVIPYTAEFAYLNTNNDKVESAKEYFLTINTLARILGILSQKEYAPAEEKNYYYIVGESIGLYLSYLYTNDTIKFRRYYDFLKKNMYIEEDKMISVFLNDKDFLRMDYLKKDISTNEKILLKA